MDGMDGMDGWWKLPTEEMNDMCNEREQGVWIRSVQKYMSIIFYHHLLLSYYTLTALLASNFRSK